MSAEHLAEQAREMDGVSFLRAIASGELPPAPIGELLGFAPVEAEPGRVVFELTPTEQHYNPIGSVHGGVAATLLDSAMSCAVHSTLPAGTGYTTLEMKVNFVRGLTVDSGPVRAEGEIVHSGSRVSTASGRLYEVGTGRLVAHGTTTCLILQG